MAVSRYSSGTQAGPMGYLGLVNIVGVAQLRAMSCSLNAKQQIQHPDVMDGRIDRTTYQLGPVEVDGDIGFPVVVADGNILTDIFKYATQRDPNGELVNTGDVDVQYSYGIRRTFNGCKANSLEIKCSAGDKVEGTLGVWGTTINDGGGTDKITASPGRILTWDTVSVTIGGDGARGETCQIREFTFRINNNLSRNYTFCQGVGLFATNISTGKRHVEGSLGFQGWALTEDAADSNRTRTTANATITCVIGQGLAAGFSFTKTFKRVIFEYQNIDLNIGLLTSTANWYAHADGADEAFS